MRIYQTTGDTYLAASYIASTSQFTISGSASEADFTNFGASSGITEGGTTVDSFGNATESSSFSSFFTSNTTGGNGAGSFSTIIPANTYNIEWNPSTATTLSSIIEITSVITHVVDYTSGTTNSRSQPTTFSSTTASTLLSVSNVSTVISTWTLGFSTFSTSGLEVPNIGEIYECESPFEVVWAYTGSLGVNQSGAFTDQCASFSKYTYFPPVNGVSIFNHVVSYASNFPPLPTITITLGGVSTILTDYTQTYISNTATVTIKKSINGLGDIAYTTSTLQFSYQSNLGLSSETFTDGVDTFSETNVFSFTESFPNETLMETTFTKISYNGYTTTIGTITSLNVISWSQTTNAQVWQSTEEITTHSTSTSFFITFPPAGTDPGGTSQGAASGLTTNFYAAEEHFPTTSVLQAPYLANQTFQPTEDSIIMRLGVDGVVSNTILFSITNSIYINYTIAGAFSYIYYPWKSTALLNSNEVYLTFNGRRNASYVDSASHTNYFSYRWLSSSLNVTSGIQTITHRGTTTSATLTTLTNTSTGTVSIGYISQQSTSNIYDVNINDASLVKVGGFGVNTLFSVTGELLGGAYAITGYTYSSDSSLASSNTSKISVAGYSSFTMQPNVMSIIQQEPLMSNDYLGIASPVNTFNNSGEMP